MAMPPTRAMLTICHHMALGKYKVSVFLRGLGLRVWGLGLRVWGLACRAVGFRVSGPPPPSRSPDFWELS